MTRAPFFSLVLCAIAACGDGKGDGSEGTGETSGSAGSTSVVSTGDDTAPTTEEPVPTTEGSGETSAETSSSGVTTEAAESSGSATDATTDGSTGDDGVIVVAGLSHPESILHDLVDDVYFISNINGAPDGKDDNGFISRVLPDGTIDALTFIDGASDEFVLDAPKGMAIVGDTLWVADLTVVRKFDRVTGASLGEVAIEGAGFLNDLATDGEGNIFVSDTGTNILHTIDDQGQATVMLASPAIFGPNGLFVSTGKLFVATFDDSKIFSMELELPAALPEISLDVGQLDGLVKLEDGDWLVSSWELPGVLRVAADFSGATTQIADLSSPADFAVDEGRKLILVPRLLEDRAEFHPF